MGNLRTGLALCAGVMVLSACSQDERPGEVDTFDGIGADEVIMLTGTEPFWSMEIKQGLLLYTTPEDLDGEAATVSRFAGNNGLGFAGELSEQPLAVAVTSGECSDGMSDRTYPFTATVTVKGEQLNGCGYTDQSPFEGGEAP